MKPPVAAHRTLDLEELGFFWNPRNWAEIIARFGEGMSGSHADIRDAIIFVDDDGGLGYLHWHADRKSWALTEKGKNWVAGLLPFRKLDPAKKWKAPEAELRAAAAEVEKNAILEGE